MLETGYTPLDKKIQVQIEGELQIAVIQDIDENGNIFVIFEDGLELWLSTDDYNVEDIEE